MFNLKITRRDIAINETNYDHMLGLNDPSLTIPNKPNYHNIYMLDITMQTDYSPREKHIEEIVNWSKRIKSNEKVIIHCMAGISRSSASAVAVLINHGMPVEQIYPHIMTIRSIANPNWLMIQMIDDYFNLCGMLKEEHKKWFKETLDMQLKGQDITAEIDFFKNLLKNLNT